MFTAKDISLETLKAIKNTIKKLSYEDYVEGDAFENVVSRIVKLAEQQGKGAVKLTDFFPKSKIDDEIRVIDKNSFKPKSQLVDIWNQANKK